MPFFKIPYTSSSFVEVLLCIPLRGCALFVPFLSQTWQYREQCSKPERQKDQQNHPVTEKGFQCSYVSNARAGAFHRGKMPSFALVVLAPGPADTRGTGSSERCLPLSAAPLCMQNLSCGLPCRVPRSPLQSRRKKLKTTATKNPQTPYLSNLTTPTNFLLFPTLRNVILRLRPYILKSI